MCSHCVFEYLYRDAANYKVFGRVVLRGPVCLKAAQTIRATLEAGELFIPEQVGMPGLQRQLIEAFGPGEGGGLDHGWHELFAIRAATPEEVTGAPLQRTLTDLAKAFLDVREWQPVRCMSTPLT